MPVLSRCLLRDLFGECFIRKIDTFLVANRKIRLRIGKRAELTGATTTF